MCKFCNETNVVLSQMITVGKKCLFVDVRFDADYNQIDVCVGDAETEQSTWTNGINIAFCPVCGKKLKEVE